MNVVWLVAGVHDGEDEAAREHHAGPETGRALQGPGQALDEPG